MRSIKQIESLSVNAGLSHAQLVGFLAYNLGFVAYYYYIMPLNHNMDDLPVILPITAAVNMSLQTK